MKRIMFVALLLVFSQTNGLAQTGSDETDIMGVCPTKIITGNGRITLCYSREGKLIALYTPSVGSYDIIPYTTKCDTSLPRYGSPEHEGMFAGIEVEGKSKWLWQLPLPDISYPMDHNATIRMTYRFDTDNGPVYVYETCLVGNPISAPKVSLQSFQIHNLSSVDIDSVKFLYYGFVHPTIKNQQPTLWLNPWLGALAWDFHNPASTKAYLAANTIRVGPDPNADPLNGQYLAFGLTSGNNTTLESPEVAGFASFYNGAPTAGVYDSRGPQFKFLNSGSANGEMVNWAVRYNLGPISASMSKTINAFIATGYYNEDEATIGLTAAVGSGADLFRSNSETWWRTQRFLATIDGLVNPVTYPYENKMAKRWTITSKMMVDTATGAIIASPNRQPKYYTTWVRDGMYQALLWEALGEREIVDRFIAYLLSLSETTVRDNQTWRYWRQCYSIQSLSRDRYEGLPFVNLGFQQWSPGYGVVENDQMGTFLWAIYAIAKHRNPGRPRDGLPSTIDTTEIRQIANTIVSLITLPDDPQIALGKKPYLLQPSFDWYEFPESHGGQDVPAAFLDPSRASISQSIYTNSSAIAGLRAANYFTDDFSFKLQAERISYYLKQHFLNTAGTNFTCPAYVALSQVNPSYFLEFPWGSPVISSYAPSLRNRLHVIAVGWPYNVFGADNVITNYANNIDVLLDFFKHDTQGKCFVPAYLMSAIYDLYKPNHPSGKIDEFVSALRNDPIGYMPENFYYLPNGEFKRRGAEPLGWSQAWGALAVLLKAASIPTDILPLFDFGQITPPTTPTLKSPANGATSQPLNPVLKWSSVLDQINLRQTKDTTQAKKKKEIESTSWAPGYWLQVSKTADFVSPIVDAIGLPDSQYAFASNVLSGSTQYRWRVKATNVLGDTSSWSQVWTFTTVGGGTSLPAPRLITPADNTTNISIRPTFDWADTTGATSYRIQVSTNSNFTSLKVNASNLTSSQYTITNDSLAKNTVYYWHVCATNVSGDGPWSANRSFTTVTGTLSSPVLRSPANGAGAQSVTARLDWDDVPGASYYTVEVDISTSFSNPNQYVNQSSLTLSEYTVPSGTLAPDKQYFWRVYASTGTQNSAWSDVSSFTTGTYQIPSSPELASPNNGAVGQWLNTELNWHEVTNAQSYALQLSRYPDLSSPILNQSGISSRPYTVPAGLLTYFTTYYWRVNATNYSLGTSPWSEVRSFTTLQLQAPAPPTQVSVPNGSTSQPLTPTLDWNDVPGALTYRLQVSSNQDFINPEIDAANLTSSSYEVPSGILNNDITYRWRVFASNGQNGDWSQTWSFTTIAAQSPPATPALVSPPDESTGQTTNPTLDWGNVTGASSYRVQVSTDLGFTAIVVDVSDLASSGYSIPSSTLSYSTHFYWRARASNQAGTSQWSAAWNFTTASQPLIQSPSDTTTVSMGQVYDVKLQNQFAFCFTETGLFRVNIQDPYHPYVQNLCRLPSGTSVHGRLELQDNYAFVANGTSGITVVDIGDPTRMKVVATFALPSMDISELAIKDSALYALSYNSKVVNVISIKDPLNPVKVNSFNANNDNYSVYALVRVSNYLYCPGRYTRIWRWTLTNPFFPSGPDLVADNGGANYTQAYFDPEGSYLICGDNNDMYVTMYTVNTTTGQLTKITQSPSSWGGDGGDPSRLAKSGTYVTITSPGTGDTQVYNVANINSPVHVGAIKTTPNDYSNAIGIVSKNNYTYMGVQGQLLVFPLGGLNVVGRVDFRGGFSDVKQRGNYLYTAAGSKGLIIYDITNQAHPFQLADLAFSLPLNRIFADSSNYIYCIGADRVFVVNVAKPSNPVPVSTITIPWKYAPGSETCYTKDMVVKNNIGYVLFHNKQQTSSPSEDEKGLAVINLNDVTNPTLITKVSTNTTTRGRGVSCLLVGNEIVSVERRYYTDNSGYVGWNGIVKYSLSNPNNPSLILQHNLIDYPVDITFRDSIYYVITGQVYGYSEPSATAIKYISRNTFGTKDSVRLSYTPAYALANANNIFISNYNTGQFNVYKRDSALTFVENTGFQYATGRFSIDSPYVYICQNYALGTFMLANLPPPPEHPALIAPNDGSVDQPITTTLDWNDVPSATAYRVQVAMTIDFGSLVLDEGNLVISNYNLPEGLLDHNTLYYWRVAASSNAGSGAWSAIWSFITVPPAPSSPVPISPANGSSVQTLTPVLSWSDISLSMKKAGSATHAGILSATSSPSITYEVQVASSSGIILDTTGLNESQVTVPTGKLAAGTQYYWHVNARDTGGTSTFSSAWSFATAPGAGQNFVLNLTVFLQGYYQPGVDTMQRDTVVAHLRNRSSPSVGVDTALAIPSRLGRVTFVFPKPAATTDSFYVVVKHRNHLGVITAHPYRFAPNETTFVDLTDSISKVQGVDAMWAESNGKFSLRGGDADGNGVVNAIDRNAYWRVQNGTSGTNLPADFNGDGAVNAIDRNSIWRPNNGRASYVP
jgi:hypothetical protein